VWFIGVCIYTCYFTAVEDWSIVASTSVGFSLCEQISLSIRLNLTKFLCISLMAVAHSSGSVTILDMVCTVVQFCRWHHVSYNGSWALLVPRQKFFVHGVLGQTKLLRSRGDNTFSSIRVCVHVCVSVCLWALSCLNCLTFNLDFWHEGRPWPCP